MSSPTIILPCYGYAAFRATIAIVPEGIVIETSAIVAQMKLTERISGFVGEISALDLASGLGEDESEALRAAWATTPVLVIPGQNLTPAAMRAFGAVFGEPQPEPPMNQTYLEDGEEAVSYVGNIHKDGTPYPFGNLRATAWHSDQSYLEEPVSGGILHALKIPSRGGGTLFCNMCAAYDALDDATRGRLEGMIGLHGYNVGRQGENGPPLDESKHGSWPTVRHPVVRSHPVSGRKSLYVNPAHTYGIEGLAEKDPLLDSLLDHAGDEARFAYYHHWKVGDVVVWDQRCLMHRGAGDAPEDEVRFLMRLKIAGDRPY